MRLDKKGQGMPYTLTWIAITSLMLIFIFGGLTLWLAAKLDPVVDNFNLEAGLLAQRLVYSPHALGAVDEFTSRPLPGIIDFSKLKDIEKLEQQLLNAIYYGDEQQIIAAKITINSATGPFDVYYNKVHYNNIQPLLGAKGVGGTIGRTITIEQVLIREDGIDTPRDVVVHVLRVKG